MPIVKVFFAYQFEAKELTRAAREGIFHKVIERLETRFSKDFPYFKIETQIVSQTATHTGGQIVELISDSDIVVVDLTEINGNVIFETGVAQACQRYKSCRTIWMKRLSTDFRKLPSDLVGLFVEDYQVENYELRLSELLEKEVRNVLDERSLGVSISPNVEDFWNAVPGGTVDIICSEIPKEEQPYFADPKDRNYLRYAKFADLDSLVFLRTRLANLFPSKTVRDFAPEESWDQNANQLLILGGAPWNSSYASFQGNLPFEFQPNELGKDDPLYLKARPDRFYGPERLSNGELASDVSVLSRLRISRDRHVYLFAGCLTYGVLGAVLSILEKGVMNQNIDFLHETCGTSDFAMVFRSYLTGGYLSATDLVNAHQPLFLFQRRGSGGDFELIINNTDEA